MGVTSVLQSAKHVKELIVPLLGKVGFFFCLFEIDFSSQKLDISFHSRLSIFELGLVCKEVFGKIKVCLNIYTHIHTQTR